LCDTDEQTLLTTIQIDGRELLVATDSDHAIGLWDRWTTLPWGVVEEFFDGDGDAGDIEQIRVWSRRPDWSWWQRRTASPPSTARPGQDRNWVDLERAPG
jgi:hypothetical protein